jgi:hypothetical protein
LLCASFLFFPTQHNTTTTTRTIVASDHGPWKQAKTTKKGDAEEGQQKDHSSTAERYTTRDPAALESQEESYTGWFISILLQTTAPRSVSCIWAAVAASGVLTNLFVVRTLLVSELPIDWIADGCQQEHPSPQSEYVEETHNTANSISYATLYYRLI